MRQQLLSFLVTLSLMSLIGGKRIEILRFNQAKTLAASDFIPVYSADVADLAPVPYNEQFTKVPAKQAELRNFEANDYDEDDIVSDSEGRNFQPLAIQSTPGLGNYQTLPQLQNYQALPELTNFELPAFATTALKNLQRQPTNEAASSGRTFKHFLLLKALLGGGGGSGYGSGHGDPGTGGFGGLIVPVIVNNPVNVTNTNNNTLVNTPAAAAAAGGAGAGDDPNGLRINYIGIPQTQQFPIQIPMQSMQMPTQTYHQPTPVYQQRQAVGGQPTFAMAMLNIPGTTQYMPFALPQQYQSAVNRDNRDGERRPSLGGWSSASKHQNPWSAFTNNLRGLQYL